MESSKDGVESVIAPLNKVTPVSKYVALVLFIILPFLGGYVGYQYAPEKIIEVQKIVYSESKSSVGAREISTPVSTSLSDQDTAKESIRKPEGIEEYECVTNENPYRHICYRLMSTATGEVAVENLTVLALSQGVLESSRSELYHFVYQTVDKRKIYFQTGIPESDACCGFVEFDMQTQKFKKRDDLYLGVTNSIISESNRYIATVANEFSVFKVADLEKGSIIYEEAITVGSLKSADCGFFGYGTDLRFSDDVNQVSYGIYSDLKVPEDTCEYQKIETKTYTLPR
jgi:hypothetical protein